MLEGRQHSGRLVHFLPCFFPIKTEEHKRRRGLNKGAEENRERAEKRGGRSKEKKKRNREENEKKDPKRKKEEKNREALSTTVRHRAPPTVRTIITVARSIVSHHRQVVFPFLLLHLLLLPLHFLLHYSCCMWTVEKPTIYGLADPAQPKTFGSGPSQLKKIKKNCFERL